MTPQAKVNLTQGAFFNSIAKKCFQAAADCSVYNAKAACNKYAAKCLFIENSIMASCKDDKARTHFRNEISLGDTLQLGNIFELYLRMTPEERDMLEILVEAIKRGEIIEVKDATESEVIRNEYQNNDVQQERVRNDVQASVPELS